MGKKLEKGKTPLKVKKNFPGIFLKIWVVVVSECGINTFFHNSNIYNKNKTIMYRNFRISEEEKQQILESHKEHGYRKPLNEASDITTNMFFKNMGSREYFRQEMAQEMRDIFTDSGIDTEGFSDQDMIDIFHEIKRLPNEEDEKGEMSSINELDSKEIGLVRGKPDFKTQTGLPVGDYVSRRNASRQFQQDFKKDFADPGDEYTPYWEKDRPNSDGDSENELSLRTSTRQANRELSKKSERESNLSIQQAREERIKLRRKIESIMDLSRGDMDADLEKYLKKLKSQYRELENN